MKHEYKGIRMGADIVGVEADVDVDVDVNIYIIPEAKIQVIHACIPFIRVTFQLFCFFSHLSLS
jgi:hypothetical protein